MPESKCELEWEFDDGSAWREVSCEELQELRPYVLDCSQLTSAACKQIRSEFKAATVKAITAFVTAMGWPPTQCECDMLRAALVRWFNEYRIPELVQGTVH